MHASPCMQCGSPRWLLECAFLCSVDAVWLPVVLVTSYFLRFSSILIIDEYPRDLNARHMFLCSSKNEKWHIPIIISHGNHVWHCQSRNETAPEMWAHSLVLCPSSCFYPVNIRLLEILKDSHEWKIAPFFMSHSLFIPIHKWVLHWSGLQAERGETHETKHTVWNWKGAQRAVIWEMWAGDTAECIKSYPINSRDSSPFSGTVPVCGASEGCLRGPRYTR